MRVSLILPTAAAMAVAAIGLSNLAAAKNNICATKHIDCNQRCIMKDMDGGGGAACMKRTCDRQFRNCIKDAAGGSDRSGTGAKTTTGGRGGPIVRDKRKPTPRRPLPGPRSMSEAQPHPATTPSNGTNTTGSNGTQRNVRDHREPPTVRDHRAKPTVRDHRAQPTVRDHREPSGVKGRDPTAKSSGRS